MMPTMQWQVIAAEGEQKASRALREARYINYIISQQHLFQQISQCHHLFQQISQQHYLFQQISQQHHLFHHVF